MNLIGMRFTENGIVFEPAGSNLIKKLELKNLRYRNAVINIKLEGSGNKVKFFSMNGEQREPFIRADETDMLDVIIKLF